jgi:hypothetical protein
MALSQSVFIRVNPRRKTKNRWAELTVPLSPGL